MLEQSDTVSQAELGDPGAQFLLELASTDDDGGDVRVPLVLQMCDSLHQGIDVVWPSQGTSVDHDAASRFAP
ncbi:hypothetical protein D3C85_1735580 [compost metagenome]